MAMFGSTAKPNWADIVSSLGAAAVDVGNGQGPQYTMALAKQRQAQMAQLQKQQATQQLFGLFGGQAAQAGAVPNVRDPQVQQALLLADAQGVDVGTALKLIEMGRPDIAFAPNEVAVDKGDPTNIGRSFASGRYENGFLVRPNDPNAPGFVPKLPDATIPDGRGGAIPVPGAAEAVARQAGMVAGAEAAGKAPFDFITVPTPSGAQRTISKAGAVGGDFTGMTPGQRIAAETAAKATATARADLPQTMETAQNALDVIDALKNHPSLNSRTGMFGALPAIPGTPGVEFDALKKQLQGQVFLDAYSTLKGGGQITEVEGKKAEAARARLDAAQTPEAFVRALDDLASVVKTGMARARSQAGETPRAKPDRAAVEAELRRRGLIR